MKLEEFVDAYKEQVTADVKEKLDARGLKYSEGELEQTVNAALEKSYHDNADAYFNNTGSKLLGGISNGLRYFAGAADAAALYSFWSLGPFALFKLSSMGAKALNEGVNSLRTGWYKKDEGLTGAKRYSASLGEGILEGAASYAPTGLGEISYLLRGSKKYTEDVVHQTVDDAERDALKALKAYEARKTRRVPVEAFADKRYVSRENLRERLQKKLGGKNYEPKFA